MEAKKLISTLIVCYLSCPLLLSGCLGKQSEDILVVDEENYLSKEDVFDLADITFSGYDKYGEADVEINDLFKSDDTENESFNFILEPTTGLSNGDEITLYLVIDNLDEFKEMFGEIPESMSKAITVNNLEEPEPIDVFENFWLAFDGSDSFGSAEPMLTVTENTFYDPDPCPDYAYTLDKQTGLSNGDIITATFTVRNLDDFVNKFGVVPEYYTKQFEVSGLSDYTNPFIE